MKNKLQHLLLIGYLLSAPVSFSQLWVEMMLDPNTNFYETQQAFTEYWEGKTIEKGKGFKQFKRWEHHMEPRVYPSGDVKLASQTMENYRQWERDQLAAGIPKSLNGSWAPLGPVGNPTNGGAGRINFIRFDPTNSNTFWVGAPDGGLWKTTNGGTSYTTNTDQLTVIGCSDVAIDPTNTQVMYLATGDGDGADTYSVGVLKSTDGGNTWNTTGLTWTVNQARTISRILVNPTNPQIVMAFASNGTWRSTNGGSTWTQVSTAGCKDAEFKPGDPNTVYAAGAAFRRSTDGGATWSTITLPLTGIGRLAIAVTAANTGYVYLLAANNSDNGYRGVMRSTDSGASFTTRSTTPNILGWDNGADAGGQGWYDLAIAVSPTNANEVFTGGVNIWRSTDGGTNWVLNSHWYGGYSKPYVHADIHDLIFLPGSGTTLFSGHDGGVSKTTNNGTSYSDITANLTIAQQYKLSQSVTTQNLVLAGHQDNGTNRLSGTTWSERMGGDGMDCYIDRTNDNFMIASLYYGDYYRSTNGGGSFSNIADPSVEGQWVSVIHQDPVTAATVYAGGRPALFRTTNIAAGTVAWSALATPPGTGSIINIGIAPSNNQVIYCLKTGTGGVSKSTNAGSNFTSTATPTTAAAPTCVAVSNTNPDVAFVTYSGYSATNKVFKTTNGGGAWTNLSTGLPNVPVNCVVYHNNSTEDAIYVGTDIGVFYRDNTTSGWIEFSTGLPRTEVSDLEIFYPTGRLRAATFGRGTWDSDLYSATPSAPTANFTGTPTTVCQGQSVQFTSTSSGFPDSYSWSFPGGTPTSSTEQNPVIVYNTAGTYNVSLTVTNAFGNDTKTETGYITVIDGMGSPIPLTEGFTTTTFPPAGWSLINNDGGATTWVRNATIGVAPTAGNSMMFDNYSYDDRGNGDEVRTPRLNFNGFSSCQLTFHVAYAPYDATYHDGLEVLVSSDCGATYTSVYSKSNTVLATAAATTASFTPTSAQWRQETVNLSAYDGMSNIIVAFRNLAGYGNRLFVDNINLNGTSTAPLPVASFTSSATTICSGNSVNFTNTSTDATSYSWSFPGGTPSSSTEMNPIVTYSTPGSYDVTLVATNSAGSDTETMTAYITVNGPPAAPGSITGLNTVCANQTGVTYSIPSVSGATSYTWAVPSGATITSGQGTTSITVNYGTSGGNVTVTASNSCGTSSASSLAVTVNTVPTAPGTITGLNSVCANQTGVTYSIPSVTGATSYTWTVPSGATIASGQGTTAITVNYGTSGGNVSVTASNSCGTSSASSLAVTVNTAPTAPGTITGLNSVCANQTGVTYSIPSVSGATSYTWTVPSGATIASGQGTTSVTVNYGTSGGNVTVTASNSCGTSSASSLAVTVNPLPATPGAITGLNTVCANQTGITYSIAAASGATSYTWTVPSGATIASGQGTTSVTVNYGTSGGNVTVTASNSCGTSSASTLAVTVNSAPSTPGAIAGSTVVCPNSTGNSYSISPVSGATSYTWTVPSGATIASGQGTSGIVVNFGSNAGNVTVTASNSCGTSSASTLAISLSGTAPATPGTISGASSVCIGDVVIYSIEAVNGATSYNWLVPSGSSINNGQGSTSISILVGSLSGEISVNASSSCGTSDNSVKSITVNAVPSAPTTSVSNGCGESELSATGSNLLWSTGASSASILVPEGSYTVTQTVNGCVSDPSVVSASPTAVPSSPSVSVVDGCNESVLSALGSNLVWSTGETTSSISVLSAGTYTVTQTVDGCISSPASITANPTSSIPAPSVNVINSCGSSVLTANGSGAFLWSTGQTSSSITVLAQGTYTVIQTENGCTSDPASITADPIEVPPAPVTEVTNSCGLATLTANGSNLQWSTGESTSTITVTTTGTFFVTQTVNGCTSPSASVSSSPLVIPSVSFNEMEDVCINDNPFALSSASPADGTYSGPGVVSNNFDPELAGYGTHVIVYDYTASNGCSNSAQQTITVGCASVLDDQLELLSIYPNPSFGTISVSGIDLEMYQHLDVLDQMGRLVLQKEVDSSTMELDLQQLASGQYLIRLVGASEVLMKKVQVIQK
jgi:PKD repeat protein